VLFAALAEAVAGGVNERLMDYYADKQNYRAVRREVLDWHGTTRNGCVAFVSTALRHVGVKVPERGKRDGYGVSRITFAFSDYLVEELGWLRLEDAGKLEPGDVVFTDGWPDHVFVFHSWSNERRRVARVIDNQGHSHRRALAPARSSDVAAFAYALRAPVQTRTGR